MSFSFFWLGVLLMLATYLLVSTLLGAAVALGGPSLERRAAAASSARRRAAVLFSACAGPTLGGLAAVFGLVLPAWLVFEPLGTDEVASPELLMVAAASFLVVARAVWRAVVEHRRTASAVSAWVRQARAAPVHGLPMSALRVEHGFPLAAVAGIVRPRLLLGSQVVDALTPTELQAVAAHEAGHLAAGDVLKRLFLRACPDLLPWTRSRRRLEFEWERAAEAAADEFAGRQVSRLVLARALVKIASLVPPGSRLMLELPAFAAGAPVAARVRHLLEGENGSARPSSSTPAIRLLPMLALAIAAAAWVVALPVALPATHAVLEALVRGLV